MPAKHPMPTPLICPKCNEIPQHRDDVRKFTCGRLHFQTAAARHGDIDRKAVKSWNDKVEEYLEQELIISVLIGRELRPDIVDKLRDIRSNHSTKHKKYLRLV